MSTMANYSSFLKLCAHAQPFDRYVGVIKGFQYTAISIYVVGSKPQAYRQNRRGIWDLNE